MRACVRAAKERGFGVRVCVCACECACACVRACVRACDQGAGEVVGVCACVKEREEVVGWSR